MGLWYTNHMQQWTESFLGPIFVLQDMWFPAICSKVWWLIHECQAWNYWVAIGNSPFLLFSGRSEPEAISSGQVCVCQDWPSYCQLQWSGVSLSILKTIWLLIVRDMHWLPVYVWYAVGITVGRKAYSQNLMQGLLVGDLKIDTVMCRSVQYMMQWRGMYEWSTSYRSCVFFLFLKWVAAPTGYTH